MSHDPPVPPSSLLSPPFDTLTRPACDKEVSVVCAYDGNGLDVGAGFDKQVDDLRVSVE